MTIYTNQCLEPFTGYCGHSREIINTKRYEHVCHDHVIRNVVKWFDF